MRTGEAVVVDRRRPAPHPTEPPAPCPPARDRWLAPGLAVATCLGAALAFPGLGSKDLWYDEVCSVVFAGMEPARLWSVMVGTEANMGLYYILLHAWMLLGDGEAHVRALSTLLALATIPVIGLLGARVMGTGGGIAAAALLAVNPFFIAYAQEARGYALTLLLLTAAGLQLLRAVKRRRWTAWAGYALLAALACYGHMLAGLVVGAQLAAAAATLGGRALPWRTLAATAAAIAGLTLPLLLFMLLRAEGQIDWVEPLSIAHVKRLLTTLAGPGWLFCFAALAAAAAATATAMAPRTKPASTLEERWRLALLWSWLLVPVAAGTLLSLVQPILVARFFIGVLPALVLLVVYGGVALATAPPRLGQSVTSLGLVMLLGLSGVGVAHEHARPKQDWSEAAELVLTRARPGDAVAFYASFVQLPFDYYASRHAADGSAGADPTEAPTRLRLEPAHRLAALTPARRTAIDARLPARHPRLWLVLSLDRSPMRIDERDALLAELAEAGYAEAATFELDNVRVVLYERSPEFEEDAALPPEADADGVHVLAGLQTLGRGRPFTP